MARGESTPTPDEIKNQLERMLASKRFLAAKNQSDFLELVVTRALAGKKSSETVIGKKLFGAKYQKDESSDVRVTATYLRQKIALYFENEGRYDPVNISLPTPSSDRRIKLRTGEAYSPIFAYNPNSAISKDYNLGVHFLTPRTAHDISNAMEQFHKVTAKNPNHLGAHIGMLEAMCFSAFTLGPAAAAVTGASEKVAWALYLGKDSWHAYAAAGAAKLISVHMDWATICFNKALQLNRKKTLEYGWYHAFLLATDRQEEAVALAKARAELHSEDAIVIALYAAHLYMARKYDSAVDVLTSAMELDRNCWLVYLVFALVDLARGDAKSAAKRLDTMDYVTQMSGTRSLFPGLAALLHVRSTSNCQCSILNDLANQIVEDGDGPIQSALLSMSLHKETEMAISYLIKAWRTFEPIVLFLHVLPLFDELRNHEHFKMLLQKRLWVRPAPSEAIMEPAGT